MMMTTTTAAAENTYPYYDFMYRHLSIREWELRLVKDEYAFLQSCGGVTVNDMAYFRTSVMRYSMLPTVVVVKNEKSKEAEEETTQCFRTLWNAKDLRHSSALNVREGTGR